MSLNKVLKVAAAATLISTFTSSIVLADDHKEKCYGVSKAGKNDCSANQCAGHSKVDNQGDSFIVLPKGVCERLANGSLQPK